MDLFYTSEEGFFGRYPSSKSFITTLRSHFETNFTDKIIKFPQDPANFINVENFFSHFIDAIRTKNFSPKTYLILASDLFCEVGVESIANLFAFFESHWPRLEKCFKDGEQEKHQRKLLEICKSLLSRLDKQRDYQAKACISLFLLRALSINGCAKYSERSSKATSGFLPEEKNEDKEAMDSVAKFAKIQSIFANPFLLVDSHSVSAFLDLLETSCFRRPKTKGGFKKQGGISAVDTGSVETFFAHSTTFAPLQAASLDTDSCTDIFIGENRHSLPSFVEMLGTYTVSEFLREDQNYWAFLLQVLVLLQFLKESEKSKMDVATRKKVEEKYKILKLAVYGQEKARQHSVHKILSRNKNWMNWKYTKCPTVTLKSETRPVKIKHDEHLKNEDEYLYRAWPAKRSKIAVKMGNLVLENIWRSNDHILRLAHKDSPTGGKSLEERFRNTKRFDSKLNDFSFLKTVSQVLPEIAGETAKLAEILKDEYSDGRVPELVRFKMLRLLKEKDYICFQNARGRVEQLAENK